MKKIMGILRVVMGFMFLWAFADKLFGLGFSTARDHAWIHGTSPTAGFLAYATHGPLAALYKGFSGAAVIDWLFMLGLLVVGVTLLINRFVRVGSIVGILMMLAIYFSVIPPANNPIIDEHIVYALIFALFAYSAKKKEMVIQS